MEPDETPDTRPLVDRAELRALGVHAMQVLKDLMDERWPAKIRLRAADVLLNAALGVDSLASYEKVHDDKEDWKG